MQHSAENNPNAPHVAASGPLIAHATRLEQAKAAIENGTKLLVHSVSDSEVDEEFLNLAQEAGTIYTPTLIVSSGYMLAYRAAAGIEPYRIDDPNNCVDQKTRKLLQNASQFRDHPRLTDTFRQRLEDFGTVEAGKFANLVILEDNPSEDISHMRSLTHVMIKGSLKEIGDR